MIAGTRAALGAGVGLLLGERLNPEQRRAVGWTLFAVGVISTIPLVAEVFFRDDAKSSKRYGGTSAREEQPEPSYADEVVL